MNQDLKEELLYKEKLMLILTRKPGQIIKIQPAADLPLTTPVGALFAEGPIEIVVQRIQGQQVRLGFQAHDRLLILREELEVSGSLPTPSQAAG